MAPALRKGINSKDPIRFNCQTGNKTKRPGRSLVVCITNAEGDHGERRDIGGDWMGWREALGRIRVRHSCGHCMVVVGMTEVKRAGACSGMQSAESAELRGANCRVVHIPIST